MNFNLEGLNRLTFSELLRLSEMYETGTALHKATPTEMELLRIVVKLRTAKESQ